MSALPNLLYSWIAIFALVTAPHYQHCLQNASYCTSPMHQNHQWPEKRKKSDSGINRKANNLHSRSKMAWAHFYCLSRLNYKLGLVIHLDKMKETSLRKSDWTLHDALIPLRFSRRLAKNTSTSIWNRLQNQRTHSYVLCIAQQTDISDIHEKQSQVWILPILLEQVIGEGEEGS